MLLSHSNGDAHNDHWRSTFLGSSNRLKLPDSRYESGNNVESRFDTDNAENVAKPGQYMLERRKSIADNVLLLFQGFS